MTHSIWRRQAADGEGSELRHVPAANKLAGRAARTCFLCALLSSAVLAGVVGVLVAGICKGTGGQFAYPLDDTYIHMAIAKNLAFHGVWGVTEHEFTASSSSAIWPLMLAGLFRCFGLREWFPLALNLLCAFGVCLFVGSEMLLKGARWWRVLALQMALIFLIPLAVIVTGGMEHSLHILLSLVFLVRSAEELLLPDKRWGYWLPLVTALMVGARFEGMFFVLTVALLFVVKGHITRALALLAAGAVPVLLQGAISVTHGWYWLPNSLLAKSELTAGTQWGVLLPFSWSVVENLLSAPHLLVLAVLVLGAAILDVARNHTFWRPRPVTSAVVLSGLALHLRYAELGWLYRYEAYLIGALLLVLALPEPGSRQPLQGRSRVTAIVLSVLLALCTTPLLSRSKLAHENTVRAGILRYYGHVLPARFLAQSARGRPIVLNDLGAVAYYTPSKVLDLCMLGSLYPLQRFRTKGVFSRADCEQWARSENAACAFLNKAWGHELTLVPQSWLHAASMQVTVDGEQEMYDFYVMNGGDAADLRQALVRFMSNESSGSHVVVK